MAKETEPCVDYTDIVDNFTKWIDAQPYTRITATARIIKHVEEEKQ